MNIGVISTRYAKALYEYAKEHNAQAAVYENMRQLKDTMRKLKELPAQLKNPSLSLPQRVALICSAVDAPSSVFEHFAALVVKNEREDILLYIAYAYIDIYRMENKIVAMKITTATPVPQEQLQSIEAIVEGQGQVSVEVRNLIDESIIGGFISEVRSVRYDASIKHQLAQIRKKIVKTNKKIV